MVRGNRWYVSGAALLLGAALVAGPAGAAGFAIFEAGAKATAVSGAFVATADDPSAAFYNPAGNAYNDKLTAMVGVTLIFPKSEFTGANPFPGEGYQAKQKSQIFFPPNLYLSYPVAPKFNLTFGTWFPYGLSTAWDDPDNFAGRFLSQRVDLRTYAVSLQGSVQLADWIAIGAGPEFRVGDVKLQRNQGILNPFTNRFVDVAHIDVVGDGFQSALTWAAGILVKPHPSFRIGASYHGAADIDFEGNTRFYQIPTGSAQLDAVVASRLPFGPQVPTETTIQFPGLFMFGVAVDPVPGLTVEVNGNYTTWDVFDETILKFATVDNKPVPTAVLPHDWKNTWTIRGGVTYKASDKLWVAAGGVYDQTPQPDEDVSPLLPDANRTGISIGAGFKMGNTSIDFSNLFLWFHDRPTNGNNDDNYNGRYETFADLFVLNFRHSF